MNKSEFEKVWNLYRGLFPGHHNLENKNIRTVWEVALTPYSLEEVVASSMAHARRSKFFPNVAEITANLRQRDPLPEAAGAERGSRTGLSWMAPYIRALAAGITDEDAEELHAAGLTTWREAEAGGTPFADWNREYRRRVPTGAAREGGGSGNEP